MRLGMRFAGFSIFGAFSGLEAFTMIMPLFFGIDGLGRLRGLEAAARPTLISGEANSSLAEFEFGCFIGSLGFLSKCQPLRLKTLLRHQLANRCLQAAPAKS
jgi:hypothetical protein